jgi:hypothetical protein
MTKSIVQTKPGFTGVRVCVLPGPFSDGLTVRCGNVIGVLQGGVMVRHDNGMRLGWMAHELRAPSLAESLWSRFRGFLTRR